MSRKLKSDKAATLLEVIIMLPLFLLGILFILWISYIANTKNSLISAVENGVRLASTRGKAGLFEATLDMENKAGAIVAIDEFVRNINPSLPAEKKELLEFNVTGIQAIEVYDAKVAEVFLEVSDAYGAPIQTLKQLPPFYTYAIAYINKAMLISYGSSLRYPCDPKTHSDQNGENCLLCYPVNPRTMDGNVINPDSFNRIDETLLKTRIAIRCDLKPGGFITRIIVSLINFISAKSSTFNKDGIMTYFTYFDSYEECGFLDAGEYSRYCCKDFNGNDYCF